MKDKKMTPQQAVARLEAICARAEHCTSEVLQKLYSWKFSVDVSRKIISHLQKNRYIDDRRYALAYARDKFMFSRWGRLKITQGLMAKRINRDFIAEAVDEAINDDDYRETLIDLLRHKARTIADVDDYELRLRLLKFGVSRGFEAAVVSSVIKSGEIWDD